MKKALLLLGIALIICAAGVFAEKAPVASGGWGWDEPVELNGKKFTKVADSYKEQDGWARIMGYGKLHYWLYDTYAYWNGDDQVLIEDCFPAWIESMGYAIDFKNMRHVAPNNDLAASVKDLMKQRGCDVSVSLITSNSTAPYFVVNNYDKDKDFYWTNIYPLTVLTASKSGSSGGKGDKLTFEQQLYELRHKNWRLACFVGVAIDYKNAQRTLETRRRLGETYVRRIYDDKGRKVGGYIVDLNGNIRNEYGGEILEYYSVPKEIRNLALKSLE